MCREGSKGLPGWDSLCLKKAHYPIMCNKNEQILKYWGGFTVKDI